MKRSLSTGEQWREIKEYGSFIFNGEYEISSWGNIRNKKTKAELATYDNQSGNGYLKTKITDIEGKRRSLYIHRLVAIYFLDAKTTKRLEVNHIDGNTKNNSFSNLEWLTHSENVKEAYRLRKEYK